MTTLEANGPAIDADTLRLYIIIAVLVFNVIVAVLVLYLTRLWSRQAASDFESLMASVGAKVEGRDYSGRFKGGGEREGIEFTFLQGPGGEHGQFLRVSIPSYFQGDFEITLEELMPHLLESAGLAKPVSTGDKEFDAEFAVMADPPENARRIFIDGHARNIVRELFKGGVSAIRHTGSRLEFEIAPFEAVAPGMAETIGSSIKRLDEMASLLPSAKNEEMDKLAMRRAALRSLVIGVPVAFLAAGMGGVHASLAFYRPLDVWDIFYDSLKYGVPATALYVYLASRWLSGKPQSARAMTFVVGFSVTGFIIGAFGLEMFFNGALDDGPKTAHAAQLISKKTEQPDRSTRYILVVRSWRQGREMESIPSPHHIYELAEPGKSVIDVTTRPGRFGFEWIVSLSHRAGPDV